MRIRLRVHFERTIVLASPFSSRAVIGCARAGRRLLHKTLRRRRKQSIQDPEVVSESKSEGPDLINQLPDYVLLLLFTTARDGPSTDHWCPNGPRCCCRSILPLRLAQVCSRWRTLVNNSPSMWTSVRVDVGHVKPEFLSMYLQRSQAALVDVTLSMGTVCAKKLAAAVDALIHHSHRWRTFVLESRSYDDDARFALLVPLFRAPAPEMRSTRLFLRYAPMNPPAPDTSSVQALLLDRELPGLRHLQLECALSCCNIARMDGLTSLSLKGAAHASVSELRKVLAQLPALSRLEMASPNPQSPAGASVITLPHLRILKISHYKITPLLDMLQALSTPELEYLHVTSTRHCRSGEDPNYLITTMAHIASTAPYKNLRVLGVHLPSRLSAGKGMQRLREFAEAFSSISHLYVTGSCVQDFLDALHNLHVYGIVRPETLWPRLTRLTIAGYDPWSLSLDEFLQCRVSAGHPIEHLRLMPSEPQWRSTLWMDRWSRDLEGVQDSLSRASGSPVSVVLDDDQYECPTAVDHSSIFADEATLRF